MQVQTQSVQQDHHGYIVDLTLNGHSVQFKIDTGADVTVIRETEYNEVRDGPLQSSKPH